MCMVSNVIDHYSDKWRIPPQPFAPLTPWSPEEAKKKFEEMIDKADREQLKKEIEEFREILKRAREYDRKMQREGCEMEEKMAKLREAAAELGIADEVDIVLKEVTE